MGQKSANQSPEGKQSAFSGQHFTMEGKNIHSLFSKTIFSSSITLKFISPKMMEVWPQLLQCILSMEEFSKGLPTAYLTTKNSKQTGGIAGISERKLKHHIYFS